MTGDLLYTPPGTQSQPLDKVSVFFFNCPPIKMMWRWGIQFVAVCRGKVDPWLLGIEVATKVISYTMLKCIQNSFSWQNMILAIRKIKHAQFKETNMKKNR